MNRPPTFSQVGIDRVGAYWDARPCNLRHSSQEVGSPAYFAEVEAKKYRVEPHILGLADFVQHRYTKVWYFRYLPPGWFRWLEQRWGWHLCVTAKLKQQGVA
jgi:hypothetical protein